MRSTPILQQPFSKIMADEAETATSTATPVLHSGMLIKLGWLTIASNHTQAIELFSVGKHYKTWNRRYFVLQGTTLSYYKKEADKTPQGVIDLAKGRGVRPKMLVKGLTNEEWPAKATEDLAFGLAVEGRTYYIYGSDTEDVRKWMTEIQKVIDKSVSE